MPPMPVTRFVEALPSNAPAVHDIGAFVRSDLRTSTAHNPGLRFSAVRVLKVDGIPARMVDALNIPGATSARTLTAFKRRQGIVPAPAWLSFGELVRKLTERGVQVQERLGSGEWREMSQGGWEDGRQEIQNRNFKKCN